MEYPLSEQSKGSIEDAKFAKLQARTLIGGIPVFSTAREITANKPIQGEIWAEHISGSLQLCIFYNNVKYPIK